MEFDFKALTHVRPIGLYAARAPDDRRRPVGLAGISPQDRSSSKSPIKQTNPASHETLRFADLVVTAGWLHPIPFRTRP
jgi:hypothetical protein